MQVYQHEIEGAMAKLVEAQRMENKRRADAREIAAWHASRKADDMAWADRLTTSPQAKRAEAKAKVEDMIRQALRLRDQAKDAVTRAKFDGEAKRLASIERSL
jgi:hypothetical protein